MGRFRVRAMEGAFSVRGQDVYVFFIDDLGNEHPIECKSLTFKVSGRKNLAELSLVLVGELDIDIAAEAAATIIREDNDD